MAVTASVETYKAQVTSAYLILIKNEDERENIPLINGKMKIKKSPNQMIVIQTNGGNTIVELHFKKKLEDQKLFKWSKAIEEVINDMLPKGQNQLGRIKEIHKLCNFTDNKSKLRHSSRISKSVSNLLVEPNDRTRKRSSMMPQLRSDFIPEKPGKSKPPPKPVRKTRIAPIAQSNLDLPNTRF